MASGSAPRWELWLYLAIAMAATLASLGMTRHSVGIDADSAAYLGTAQNIVDGRGVTTPFSLFTDDLPPRQAASVVGEVPLTHFPPLYPVALAAISAAGADVETAARALGAVLIGINLLLLALLARPLVPSVPARVGVVMLAAIGPVAPDLLGLPARTWLLQHSQAMAEGLFTTFTLLTLLAIERHLRAPSRHTVLLIAGAAALALSTRYTGIAVLAAAALAVTIAATGTAVQRACRGAAVATLAVAPTIAWQIAQTMGAHASAARSAHWPNRGAPGLSTVFAGLSTVFEGWLGVGTWSPALRHLVLAAVAAAVVVGVAASVPHSPRRRMLSVLGALTVIYIAVVVVTRSVLDASTPIDARIFLPLQGPCYLLVVAALSSIGLSTAARRGATAAIGKAMPVTLAGVSMLLVLVALPSTWPLLTDGLPPLPAATATARSASTLPEGALIATNIPAQVWQATGRSSISVPLRITVTRDKINPDFQREVRALAALICARHGYIVLLGGAVGGFGTMQQANEVDFAPLPALRVARHLADGLILAANPAGCSTS